MTGLAHVGVDRVWLGGRGLLSFSVHPGGIQTELGRHLTDELIAQLVERHAERSRAAGEEPRGIRFKTVEAGAATQVWAATARHLAAHNGAYLADCRLGELGVDPGTHGMRPWILDDETAQRLWELSEELVGLRFD